MMIYEVQETINNGQSERAREREREREREK
jgi:hypothetical protein